MGIGGLASRFFGRAMRLETSTESWATRASGSRGMPGLLPRPRSEACSKRLPHAGSGAFPRLILSLTAMKTHPGAGNLQVATKPVLAFSKNAQGPNQAAAIVERIAVEPQNYAKY